MTTANPETGAVEMPQVDDVRSAALAIENIIDPPQETEATETEQEEVAEVEETEVKAEDLATEEYDVEVDTEETTDKSEEEEADEAEEAPSFQSIEELAEALDMPVEDFLSNIKGKVKVNGEESEITLSEALKGYQLESDYRRKTGTLADERRVFEQEQTDSRTQLETRITEANTLLANLEQNLIGDYQSVNWDELRSSNPAEWSAKQQEFQMRQQQVESMKYQANGEIQRIQQESQQKAEKVQSEYLVKEAEALTTAIPEWKDTEKAKAGKAKIKDYLSNAGFSNEEINQIHDHRVVMMVKQAMEGGAVNNAADIAVKKISKLPKLQKPGSKQSKTQLKANRDSDLRKKLRATGGSEDAAAEMILNRL